MLVLYLGTVQELQQQLILPLPSIKIAKVMTPPPFLLSILSCTTPVIPDSPPPYNADAIIERSIEQKMSA